MQFSWIYPFTVLFLSPPLSGTEDKASFLNLDVQNFVRMQTHLQTLPLKDMFEIICGIKVPQGGQLYRH